MIEQFDIFGNAVKPTPKPNNKEKRNWENAFQNWSNKSITKTNITEPYGVCGYGSMCDYCEDNTYGRPCVRALNELCKVKKIKDGLFDISDITQGDLKSELKKLTHIFEDIHNRLFEKLEPDTSIYQIEFENLQVKSFLVCQFIYKCKELNNSLCKLIDDLSEMVGEENGNAK